MRERFDIVVVGAGPAGSLVALMLARAGCDVALFDRGRSPDIQIGETLPPQISKLLADLGLLKNFIAQGHRRSPGTVSAWGSAEANWTDYLFSTGGDGWHVDRSAFNRMLRDAAIDAGAVLVDQTRIDTCVPSAGGWRIRAGDRGWACQLLVDATGRHPSGKLPHGQRSVYDRLISVAGLTDTGTSGGRAPSDYTLIESAKHGWFYSALLPSGRYIVTFTTDADIYAEARATSPTFFEEQLRAAPLTYDRIRDCPRKRYTFSAVTMRRTLVAQDNWLAVGDAARSYDPLCGLGVWNAINGSVNAAQVIREIRAGNTLPIEEYNRKHQRAFAKYLEKHSAHYAMERRWAESPFWARRHCNREPRVLD